MTIEQTIEQYELLKMKIDELQNEADALKPMILAAVPIGAKVESKYGTLTVSTRGKWEYSDIVQAMTDRLSEQMKREKADGTAIEIPGDPFVTFKKKS